MTWLDGTERWTPEAIEYVMEAVSRDPDGLHPQWMMKILRGIAAGKAMIMFKIPRLGFDRYTTSREWNDKRETNLLRDVAFNRHSMNDGHHKSPYDNGKIQVGTDGIIVKLVQGIDVPQLQRTLSMATRATIGIDLEAADDDFGDWEEMLEGGLQTALETQVICFAVQGVSRTCTHQLVRSRKAAFHQQSQRASYYGDRPEVRCPESVWRNPKARAAYLVAQRAAHEAYRIACEEDISYQDARYCLGEATCNYILLEYSIREFLNVFAYRGCSMFSWEIVQVMRECRRLLVAAHPFMAKYVKITCEKSGKCTFQGWEQVEGQCDRPEAREDNRTFRSKRHEIKQLQQVGDKFPARAGRDATAEVTKVSADGTNVEWVETPDFGRRPAGNPNHPTIEFPQAATPIEAS